MIIELDVKLIPTFIDSISTPLVTFKLNLRNSLDDTIHYPCHIFN